MMSVAVYRFNDSYVAAWSVMPPDISDDAWRRLRVSSRCSVDNTASSAHSRSHSSTVERLMQQLLDDSRADATRYHVTEELMTSLDDDNRDITTPPEMMEDSCSAGAWLDEYWRHAWTLFVGLDLLLVAARATVTYVNASAIYARRQHAAILSNNHCIANGQAGLPVVTSCQRSNVKSSERGRGSSQRSMYWSWLVHALSSKTLLVVVHLCSLVALLYLAARVVTSSSHVDVVTDVIYGLYALQVHTHRSMSDAIIREQAELTTASLMQSAQHFDLLSLRDFDPYFRLGKVR